MVCCWAQPALAQSLLLLRRGASSSVPPEVGAAPEWPCSADEARSAQRCYESKVFHNARVRKSGSGPGFPSRRGRGWAAGSGKLPRWCQEWFSMWQCVETGCASCCNIQREQQRQPEYYKRFATTAVHAKENPHKKHLQPSSGRGWSIRWIVSGITGGSLRQQRWFPYPRDKAGCEQEPGKRGKVI